MLKKILFVVGGVIAVFLIVVAMQPGPYTISRSTTIGAPPEKVFPLINDFHNFGSWSPWEKLDPNMKKNFTGAPSGTGAVYSWAGNSEAGEGRMTIEESVPASLVRMKLEFIKPFESTAQTSFALKPQGDGVVVEWTMNGENNFVGKAFGLFMGGMDKMVGPDFERGLAQMKRIAEAK